MNNSGCFADTSEEDTQKPKKKSKAFEDISKYFSKEEWAKLGYSEKLTYVYMKRNYDAMTNLGLRAALPPFMCCNTCATKSQLDEDQNPATQDEPPLMASSMQQSEHLKMKPMKPSEEENDPKVVPETADLMKTSGSEQAQKQPYFLRRTNICVKQTPGKKENPVWTCRLREKKKLVTYAELSDSD